MAPEDNPADEEPIDRQSYVLCELFQACRYALNFLGKEVIDDSTPRDAELAEKLEIVLHLTSAANSAARFMESLGIVVPAMEIDVDE